MSAHTTVANNIRSYYNTNVEIAESLVTLYDNTVGDVPSNNSTDLWSRVTILEGESLNTDFGASTRRIRTIGTIEIQLFSGLNIGDGAIRALADTIKDLFTNVTLSNLVVCRVPSLTVIGPSSGWWQLNLTCPFYYDDFN